MLQILCLNIVLIFLSYNNNFFTVKFNYPNQLHNLCVLPSFFFNSQTDVIGFIKSIHFLGSFCACTWSLVKKELPDKGIHCKCIICPSLSGRIQNFLRNFFFILFCSSYLQYLSTIFHQNFKAFFKTLFCTY